MDDLISMAKIAGDLFGGYVVHIVGAVGAILLANEGYQTLMAAAAPLTKALG